MSLSRFLIEQRHRGAISVSVGSKNEVERMVALSPG